MIRNLAFITVRVLEVCLGVVGVLAPFICIVPIMALQELGDRLAPPAPLDPNTDLRIIYFQEDR